MAKYQVPTVGGIRKVIRTQPQTSATTIAGLEGLTVTLDQLAAIITQIQAQQVNNGGGNIGDGTEAFLQPGPGLAGGGPMLGTVQIRLIAPIPALLAEDGQDGDPGPPGLVGARGVTGAQGPVGPAAFLEADEGPEGERGPPGGVGPAGTNGTNGAAGAPGVAAWSVVDETWTDEEIYKGLASPGSLFLNSLTIAAGTGTRALTVSGNGQASTITATVGGPNYAIRAIGASGTTSFTGTTALGISLTGASSTNDFSGIDLLTTGSSTPQARIAAICSGGGSALMFGTSNNYASGITNIALTLDLNSIGVFASAAVVTSSIAIKGATPAVTAGQTDLGNSTTATVITTAGGIALPALANTFWKINLNGVALGIPCFAL